MGKGGRVSSNKKLRGERNEVLAEAKEGKYSLEPKRRIRSILIKIWGVAQGETEF